MNKLGQEGLAATEKVGGDLARSLTRQAYIDLSNLVAVTDYERSLYLRQKADQLASPTVSLGVVKTAAPEKKALMEKIAKLQNQIADLQVWGKGQNLLDIGAGNQEGPCYWIGVLRARRDALQRKLDRKPPLTLEQKNALAKKMLGALFGLSACDKLSICGTVAELTGRVECALGLLQHPEDVLDTLVDAVVRLHDVATGAVPDDPNAREILDAYNKEKERVQREFEEAKGTGEARKSGRVDGMGDTSIHITLPTGSTECNVLEPEAILEEPVFRTPSRPGRKTETPIVFVGSKPKPTQRPAPPWTTGPHSISPMTEEEMMKIASRPALKGFGNAHFLRGVSARLAQSRLAVVAKRGGRLGQVTVPDSIFPVSNLLGAMPVYDAFVKFVIDSAPSYINANWKTAYQVNEALLSLDRNYASVQSARTAAAWGLQFPDNMRADVAFERMELAAAEWNELFLGNYEPLTGFLTNSEMEASAAANLANLGPYPTFIYKDGYTEWSTLSSVSPSITKVKTLKDGLDPEKGYSVGSQDLFYWYDHVYRALQVFIVALGYRLNLELPVTGGPGGAAVSELYNVFVVPNVSDPRRFALWAVVSSFNRFFEIPGETGTEVLRELLTDPILNDIKAGTEDAGVIFQAEFNLGSLIGQSIQQQIDYLTAIQNVLKVLAMPVKMLEKLIENLPELAGSSWLPYILGGVGALVVIGGVFYFLK